MFKGLLFALRWLVSKSKRELFTDDNNMNNVIFHWLYNEHEATQERFGLIFWFNSSITLFIKQILQKSNQEAICKRTQVQTDKSQIDLFNASEIVRFLEDGE